MARCVVTRALPGDAIARLRAQHDVEVWGGALPPEPGELRRLAAGAHGILSLLTDRIDEPLMASVPELTTIANYAVGSDNVDLDAARRRGIQVGVTPDVLTDATADLALALMLALARRIPEAMTDVRDGRWRTWEPSGWLGKELRGARLAVVGGGRIGSAVAERARAFGLVVDVVGRGDDLRAALAAADIVSLHVPLTADTRGMIGEAELAAMPRDALLINTARGGLLDHDALVRALREKRIGGAGLDVTDPEPLPPSSPLLELPEVIVVPHIGSATAAARERMAQASVDNLLAGLAGRRLPYPAG